MFKRLPRLLKEMRQPAGYLRPLLVEQKLFLAMDIADRVYVMGQWSGRL